MTVRALFSMGINVLGGIFENVNSNIYDFIYTAISAIHSLIINLKKWKKRRENVMKSFIVMCLHQPILTRKSLVD